MFLTCYSLAVLWLSSLVSHRGIASLAYLYAKSNRRLSCCVASNFPSLASKHDVIRHPFAAKREACGHVNQLSSLPFYLDSVCATPTYMGTGF
jgi:hypothetical protein